MRNIFFFRNEKDGKEHKAKIREYDFDDEVIEYIFTNKRHSKLWAIHKENFNNARKFN